MGYRAGDSGRDEAHLMGHEQEAGDMSVKTLALVALFMLAGGCRNDYWDNRWELLVDGEHYFDYGKKVWCELDAARLAAQFNQSGRPMPELVCKFMGRVG